MRSAKDLRIIVIEGGDFTGKTTQAKLLAEKLDGLNIVIHFPRVNLRQDVRDVYNKTSNVLYNMDFWMKEFWPLIDGEFINYESVKESYVYNKILNVISENVDVNYIDKILFIEDLNKLITKNITIPYLADIAECIYDNHKVIPINNYSGPNMTPDSTDTNNFLNKCIGNTKVNIILDRFSISGYVYNKCIPIRFINAIKHKFCLDIVGIDPSPERTVIIEELFESLTSSIRNHQIHADNKIAKDLNTLFESSNDHINWKTLNRINPCFYNIRLMNTNEELIKKLSGNAEKDSSRKFDEYDKNDFIQKNANKLFNSSNSEILNPFTPDMDIATIDVGSEKYCTENTETNIENINKDIIDIVQKHENKYNEFCKNISEYLKQF